ncbi:MAG: HlyD family efflux transporter periplasmic adaptor subunit [Planctomycetota bacterium]
MKKLPNITALLLHGVAPLAVLTCAAWFVYAMGAREKPERKKPPVRKSVPVEVVQAVPHTGKLDISAYGVVIPFREVEISTRVGGEVVFKSESLSPGHTVDEGDLLLQIEDSDYKLEVSRLEQQLAVADVELERLKVDVLNAERLLKINRRVVSLRQRELDRLDQLQRQQATSAAESDAAQLAFLTASQDVTTQENLIRSFETQAKALERTKDLAKLQLQRANLDLQRTRIVAPFSGVVIANHVEQNAVVAPGTRLATLEDTASVEVRCNLRSDDIPFLRTAGTPLENAYDLPAVPVTVEYDRGGQTYAWNGVLSRQDGLGLDQATRTLPVRIHVDNPTQKIIGEVGDSSDDGDSLALVRGMFVKVVLHCEPTRMLAKIPETVLRPGKQVWLMRDEKLEMQTIRIARIQDGNAFIDMTDSALQVGDRIVSSPVPNARNGLPISILSSNPKRNNVAKGQGKSRKRAKTAPPITQAAQRAGQP